MSERGNSGATLPLTVLTGFLGSGKTTLLARLLKAPELARTAVIINEFGAVGLDHDLVEASEESIVELETGCLCCTVRGDLTLTLEDLLRRREMGSVPAFERVVIETSGLADPAPILHALMGEEALAQRLSLASVVATIDAVSGLATLERQPESVKQAAMADRLILTKTDMVEAVDPRLLDRVRRLNPAAPMLTASHGAVAPEWVLGSGDYDLAARIPEVTQWLAHAGPDGSEDRGHGHDHGHQHGHLEDHAPHDDAIACVTLVRAAPLPAVALTLLLEILAEHYGGDLLRLKGLINVAESPGRPAVVHGVQHVFHPPVWLDRWPSEDRRSRLVLIGRGLSQAWVERLVEAVAAEVAEVAPGQVPGGDERRHRSG